MNRTDRNRYFFIVRVSLLLLCISELSGLSFAGSDQEFGIRSFTRNEEPSANEYSASFSFENKPGAGKFLVAAENMSDPRFRETVILICRYDSDGALGLIINRPTGIKLPSILPDVEDIKKSTDNVYIGGPVGIEQLFLIVRSDSAPEQSLHIFGNVYLSSSLTTLKELIGGEKTDADFRVYAGYAGWVPEQLDREVARGDWHIFEGDDRLIFDRDASSLWPELILRTSVIQVML